MNAGLNRDPHSHPLKLFAWLAIFLYKQAHQTEGLHVELRGIQFKKVMNASGARGFFCDTNSFQWPTPVQADWSGSTFVAKTTTLHARAGNMPFKDDKLTASEPRPACITVDTKKEIALNAVGLSGPGVNYLLQDGRWQLYPEPFFISFMSVEKDSKARLKELESFVQLLQPRLKEFKSPIGLQINFSCPNVGLHLDTLTEEVSQSLQAAESLNIPLVPKFNIVLTPKQAVALLEPSNADAVCISNTLPWNQLKDSIDWRALWGTNVSPLDRFGGGGLSGKPLLPLVVEWIRAVRKLGLTKPIIGGAGIVSAGDAKAVLDAGANAVNFGTLAMLYPERVQEVIHYANNYKGGQ